MARARGGTSRLFYIWEAFYWMLTEERKALLLERDLLEELQRGLEGPLEHPPEAASHCLRGHKCNGGFVEGAADAEGYGDEGATLAGNYPS